MDIFELIKLYTRLRKEAERHLLDGLGFGNVSPAKVDLLVEEEFHRLAASYEIDNYDLSLLLRLHASEQADRRGRTASREEEPCQLS